MDPQIVDLARTAGTTVVALMATHAWEAARDQVVTLWRRFQPERADGVEEELEASRDELLGAGETDGQVETDVAAEWQARVRRLLANRPEAVPELRQVLDELTARLPESQRPAVGHITMRAEASGSGRVYQAGRDQHIGDEPRRP